ncbi:putative 2OG-Fe(II) oxygenase [Aureococcus anophagefferens]|nr:putative 2OG-Fe(II) oxygenase [Aureococcus anophagefferens]
MRTWYSSIIFFLLGDLAAADATAGHPDVDPSSELRDGLSALFATPVLSAALRDCEADADVLLRDVAPDIDADWRTYLASPDRPDYEDPGDLNDGFFRWQMRAGAWQRQLTPDRRVAADESAEAAVHASRLTGAHGELERAAPHRGRWMDAARPTPWSRADIEALRRQAAEDDATTSRKRACARGPTTIRDHRAAAAGDDDSEHETQISALKRRADANV